MGTKRSLSDAKVQSLIARLDTSDSLAAGRALVDLAELADPSAVRPLLAWLPTAPDRLIWEANETLRVLTGREPFLGDAWRRPDLLDVIRRLWTTMDLGSPPRPRLEQVEVWGVLARLDVIDGAGLVSVARQPTERTSSWPRWYLHLTIAGQHVYRVGSICGTCETSLQLLGWPDDEARRLATAARAELADVNEITTDLVAALDPLLCGMRTGRYRLALVDLDLERVAEPRRAWLARREAFRVSLYDDAPRTAPDPTADAPAPDPMDWPLTEHLQVRAPLATEPPTFAVVLPSAPVDGLDEETVTAHEVAIRGGARPAAVLTAWIDDTELWDTGLERFVVGVVLDGHHKLEAYLRAGVPARVLLVCRIEDSSDMTVLDEVLENLLDPPTSK